MLWNLLGLIEHVTLPWTCKSMLCKCVSLGILILSFLLSSRPRHFLPKHHHTLPIVTPRLTLELGFIWQYVRFILFLQSRLHFVWNAFWRQFKIISWKRGVLIDWRKKILAVYGNPKGRVTARQRIDFFKNKMLNLCLISNGCCWAITQFIRAQHHESALS